MVDVRAGVKWIGQSLPRREDRELVTGLARYMGDLRAPGMLHAVFLRSPHANARISAIDVSGALALEGVRAVLTGADLPVDLAPQPCNQIFEGQRDTPYYALARDRVRYVGEPVAIVVADSEHVAEDGRDEIDVSWEPMPAVGDVEAALAAGAPLLYDGWPDNVAGTFDAEIGDVDAALAEAEIVVRERFRIPRIFPCPLEGRGVLAEWNGLDELTLWTSTQRPNTVRDFLSWMLDVPAHRIRVLTPRVGGAFGGKYHVYPEETAVAIAARVVRAPVRWIEDRIESFVATVHAREQTVDAVMSADADGRITGVSAQLIGDQGAALHTTSYGPLWMTSVMMTNVYEIRNARVSARSVVTNKTPVGSYRGWGQPEANFVVERLVDLVADELGLDPSEVRRRNFVPPDHFPYASLSQVFDAGSYADCLDKALTLAGMDGWRSRQEQLRAEGRYVGIGLAFYTENTAVGNSRGLNAGGVRSGGYDIARVRMETNGEVMIYTGLSEMGQGFTNAFAQIAADALGVHPESVLVMTGDTSACPVTGYGSGASRSASVGGAAVAKAAGKLREKVNAIAAHMLGTSAGEIEAESGRLWVRGAPERSVTMVDIGRAAWLRAIELPEAMDPGLEAIEVFDPDAMTWPYGVNIAIVEVDAELGAVEFLDYVYVHDCGTIINPAIVDGQIYGGVAQGIGMALLEQLRYDDAVQPLTGTFMEYLLPTATDVPSLRLGHECTPSKVIPGGVKGCGEAGAIGSPAAVVSAIEDALRPFGVRITELPVTPDKILAWIGEPTRMSVTASR
jgi:carbon-monoxide dehydrogenase large subunit